MSINEFIDQLNKAKRDIEKTVNSEEGSISLSSIRDNIIYIIGLANGNKDASFNGPALMNFFFKLDEPRVYFDINKKHNYNSFDRAKSMLLEDLDYGIKYIPIVKENPDK